MIGVDGSRYSHRDDRAATVEHHAETPERPAVVGDRHEEARRQAIQRADLAADQRHLAAESHRADVEVVHLGHDARFDRSEPRIRVDVVERAEQLLLGVRVAGRAIAADAHADGAGAAAFALRVPDRVQDALPDAFERAIGASEVRQLDRQRVLRVGVLAAAALQNQLDLDLVALPLVEVHDRRARAEVVARVLAGDRVDRVRPQLAAPRRLGDGLADLLAHPDLIGADRRLHLEGRHAGVLADRPFVVDGEVDVLRDDRQRLRCARPGRLGVERRLHRRAHVGRQIGRGADDELEHAVEEGRKHRMILVSGRVGRIGQVGPERCRPTWCTSLTRPT